MATVVTFTSLQTTVTAYLERGGSYDTAVINQLPELINTAERRISRELKILGFQRPMNNAFTAGNPVMPKPDRWRETISFNYGQFNPVNSLYTKRTPLFERSYEFLRQTNPDDSITGLPQYYADYDYNNWVIAPTPDFNYPFEVMYWEMPALLDSVNTTNWITQYAPEVLIYSTLLECTPFLKNDDRIPTWQALLDSGMKALANENIQDMVSRSDETKQPINGTAQ